MASKIVENILSLFISILHYGFLEGDSKVTTGEQVEKWTEGHENYTLQESNKITIQTFDIDTRRNMYTISFTDIPKHNIN
jgi:hypothetical protein